MEKPKIGVFIGRLQPMHNAHLAAINIALSEVEKMIIILGSDCQAKTIKNPWTTAEREVMIRKTLSSSDNERLAIIPAKDYLYNDNLWLAQLQSALSNVEFRSFSESPGWEDCPPPIQTTTIDLDDCEVTLYGHAKDRSTHYLKLFPQWNFKETGNLGEMNATKIRDMFFHKDSLDIKECVPDPVFKQLNSEINTDTYKNLYNEYRHISEYREMWSKVPYPPTFVTTDAVVIKSGHVLVVRRRGYPGKGLLALPGGFINPGEQVLVSCLRELKEETQIGLPKDELSKRVVYEKVFDHPDRSLRGRTITHGFCIDLGSGLLPKVKGSDDAEKAFWMPLRDVFRCEEEFFEDHFHIINYFTSRF